MNSDIDIKDRAGFLFYRSFWEAIKELPDNYQLDMFRAITIYSLNGESPVLEPILKGYWSLIVPILDANSRKYFNAKQTRSKPKANEKQMRSKREQTEANEKQTGSSPLKEGEVEVEVEVEVKKEKVNEKEIGQKKIIRKITPKQFESFWEIYPLKKDKGKAMTKWNSVCSKSNKKDIPNFRQIKKAILLQSKSKRWREGFIPHPTTWINQSRWLDDPAEMNESSFREINVGRMNASETSRPSLDSISDHIPKSKRV